MNLKEAGIYDVFNLFKGEYTSKYDRNSGRVIDAKPRLINIPAYQRPYRWPEKEEYINKLFKDYEGGNDSSNSQYFLGATVAVEKEAGRVYDIVDGQQRITTLYLLNYIRFLLWRKKMEIEISNNPTGMNTKQFCDMLKETYDNLVAQVKDSGSIFEPLDEAIMQLAQVVSDEGDLESKKENVKSVYWDVMKIADEQEQVDDTENEIKKKMSELLSEEQLCLTYSRTRYTQLLREALCSVYICKKENVSEYELKKIEGYDPFCETYITALRILFENVWEKAKKEGGTLAQKLMNAIKYINCLLQDFNFCLVLTEKTEDANKLFEVLNDRAMEVKDLELIKNYFYMAYCNFSGDEEIEIDKRINELDELWTDKIFSNETHNCHRLIAYMATVFITQNENLDDKNDVRFGREIEENYLNDYCETNKYTLKKIQYDFNVFCAMATLLKKFDVIAETGKKANNSLLKAVQDSHKSITYQTLHLLNTLGYKAVLTALSNVILAHFIKQNNDELEISAFETYLDNLLKKTNHHDIQYKAVNNYANVLWKAALKANDFNIPREIAKKMIPYYGKKTGFMPASISLDDYDVKLDQAFEDWYNGWKYAASGNKPLKIKVLFLCMMRYARNSNENGYCATQVELVDNAMHYDLDVAKLQLDHIEAQRPNPDRISEYYCCGDMVARDKIVNGSIGNMMVLDHKENNKKNNLPMKEILQFYSKTQESWLIQDIQDMMADEEYFDQVEQIPKEAFFSERERRLKRYFKRFIDEGFTNDTIEITF